MTSLHSQVVGEAKISINMKYQIQNISVNKNESLETLDITRTLRKFTECTYYTVWVLERRISRQVNK